MQEMTVLTTVKYQGAHWQGLCEALEGAEILRFENPEAEGFGAALERADVAILAADPDDRILSAPRLRWNQSPTISLESVVFPDLVASDVVLTKMRDIQNDHISTHVLALLLGYCRDLPRLIRRLTELHSPTGAERNICEFLASHLSDAGLEARYQPVFSDSGNCIARLRGSPTFASGG